MAKIKGMASEEKEKSDIHRTEKKLTQKANAFKETLFSCQLTLKFKGTTRIMIKFSMACAIK